MDPNFGYKFRLRKSPGASESVFRLVTAPFLQNKKWKGTKGGGIPSGWEEGQNYNWTPQKYLAKLSAIRQKANYNKRRMGDGRNVGKLRNFADEAIYYNELCYGETPKVPTHHGLKLVLVLSRTALFK